MAQLFRGHKDDCRLQVGSNILCQNNTKNEAKISVVDSMASATKA